MVLHKIVGDVIGMLMVWWDDSESHLLTRPVNYHGASHAVSRYYTYASCGFCTQD